MRVLLVVHGFPPAATGGTEIYSEALARAPQGGVSLDARFPLQA